jgi:hypothetical protein
MSGSGAGGGRSDEARCSCSSASAEMPIAWMSFAPPESLSPPATLPVWEAAALPLLRPEGSWK